MKILCICDGGNSRSVGAAYLLKEEERHEAIAIGLARTTRETRKMLYEWADRIVLTVGKRRGYIPEEYVHKLRVWDVGPDTYFLGYKEELLSQLREYLKTNPL